MCETQPWMQLVDERILEYLRDAGDSFPFEISLSIAQTASTDRISERCWVLANAELVDASDHRIGHDRYATKFGISERGVHYLEGVVSAELIRPLPAPRPPHATRPGWWAGFG